MNKKVLICSKQSNLETYKQEYESFCKNHSWDIGDIISIEDSLSNCEHVNLLKKYDLDYIVSIIAGEYSGDFLVFDKEGKPFIESFKKKEPEKEPMWLNIIYFSGYFFTWIIGMSGMLQWRFLWYSLTVTVVYLAFHSYQVFKRGRIFLDADVYGLPITLIVAITLPFLSFEFFGIMSLDDYATVVSPFFLVYFLGYVTTFVFLLITKIFTGVTI